MHRCGPAAVLASLLLLGLRPAAAADEFKREFRYGPVRLQLVDAIAFRHEVDEPPVAKTFVAFTDFKLDRAAVVDAIEPWGAIFQQARKAQGNAILVELTARNRCGVAGALESPALERPLDLGLGSDHSLKVHSAGELRVAGCARAGRDPRPATPTSSSCRSTCPSRL